MLRPSKHDHPDRTTLHLAALLLKHLQRRRVESYSELRSLAVKKVDGGEALLGPALNLLFLLGLTDYQRKSDSFEFLGPER